jgi:hypothetical protein
MTAHALLSNFRPKVFHASGNIFDVVFLPFQTYIMRSDEADTPAAACALFRAICLRLAELQRALVLRTELGVSPGGIREYYLLLADDSAGDTCLLKVPPAGSRQAHILRDRP